MDAVARRAIRGEGTTEIEWCRWPGLARLPAIAPQELVPQSARAVVVAPHPDDEVLSVGGLLALLADCGRPVEVIAVTDGTASHRGSTEWPVERLARTRPRESRKALHCLGLAIEPARLGLPDGGLKGLRACSRPSSCLFSGPVTWCSPHGARTAIPTTKRLARPARWRPRARAPGWWKCPSGAGTGPVPAIGACPGNAPSGSR